MDENSQAGRKGLVAAAQKGIPVVIMKPLRGGALVNHLPKTVEEKIKIASTVEIDELTQEKMEMFE